MLNKLKETRVFQYNVIEISIKNSLIFLKIIKTRTQLLHTGHLFYYFFASSM
jgi:hypothetical protein